MRDSDDPSRTAPMRRLFVLGLVFVAAILSCGKDVTGPLGAAARFVRGFAFEPLFPAVFQAAGGAGSGIVQFTKVHVVLHHTDGTVALDTTIDFPAGADSLTVDLTVKLLNDAPASGEPMTLNLGYINAAGDTVFKGGPVSLTAAPPPAGGGSNPPVKVPVSYSGPGSTATTVLISPRSGTVLAGAGFQFTAVAKDQNGVVLPATPIIWNSLDPTIASITSAAAGAGTAHALRGTARIIAQLFSGAADTVQLNVTLPAANLVAQSGNGQFGVVGTNLALPLVVKVAATDGIGVAGTTVNFAVATGGGSVGNASAVSDANGLAQTTFKLGTGTGAQSVTATAAGLTGSPVTFSDTAQAATASKLVVTTQPTNGLGGSALAAFVVTAEDNNGNIATTFTGPVTIAFGNNTPAATLSGTLTVNSVLGVATFNAAKINKAGTGYTLVASSGVLTSATTNAFDIAAGPAATLALSSGDAQSATTGSALPLPIVVKITDLGGNAVSGTSVAFATANGSVSPASSASNAAGLASTTWTLGATVGAQTMTATSAGLTGSPLTIGATATSLVAGPASQLQFSTSPSAAVAGVANAPAIVVQALDAGGLLATTFVGNVTLAIGTNPGGSVLGGTLTVAAVAGVATFPNINLNKSGVGYTLTATSGALTPGASAPFTITAAAAANFAITAGNGQLGIASAVLATPLTVKVTDAFGNAVAGRAVGFAITTGGGLLGTTAAITDVAGQATSVWTLGAIVGAQTVTATSAGLAGSPAVFTATASAAGTRTWTGATSTAWTTASNWSPVGVPVAADSVVVPLVATLPTLSTTTTIKALTLAPSAVLTFGCGNLTINGSLDATGTISGCGSVVLASATAATVKGILTMPVQVSGPYTVTAAFSTNSLQVLGAGSVNINGFPVVVGAGGISTAGTATITMTQPGSTLTTTGGASFAGGSETGLLTSGTLTVAGNFSEGGGAADAFNASAGHTTILNGAVATNFSFADPNTSSFGNLIINDVGGVTALTTFQVNNLTLTAGIFSGALGGTINGTLTDPLGKLALANVSFGSSTTPISATTPTITVSGAITFNMNPSILAASLTVNAPVNVLGNLQLNGHTLTVNGNFATQVNGQLTMNNAGDLLNVNGDATFGSTGAGGPMTQGTMNVTGNFTQTGNVQSLSALTSNTIVLNGAGAQIVNFGSPDVNYTAGCAASCFNNLTINKATGSTQFTSQVKVLGNYNNSGVAPVTAPATNGSFIVVGNATFGQNAVYHRVGVGTSTYIKSGLTTLDTVTYFGAAQTYTPAALAEGNSDIRGTVNWSAPGTHTGIMTVSGTGQLNISTAGATVVGTFSTNGTGTLKMTTNATDSLHIKGNVVFGGGSTDGLLTAGYFIVDSTFDMGSGTQYSSTAAHTTVLGGNSTQNILLSSPVVGKGFNDVWMRGTGNKPLVNAIVYARDVNVGASVTTGITGFTWQLSGKLTDSSAVANGAWRPNATVFTNAPAKLPRKISGNIAFKGGAVVLVDTLYVGAFSNGASAQVVVDGGSTTLSLSGFKVQIDTVVGVFTTQNGAKLIMTNAADTLKASDYFFGGGQSNQLTNGSMVVYGNFTQNTTANAFQATAPHTTYLAEKNVAGRTVLLGNPGYTGGLSHFGDLYLSDTLSTNLLTDIYVDGELETGIVTSHAFNSGNHLVTSRGANVRDLFFTNTRWLIVDGDAISFAHNVQFLGMTSTFTQMEVQQNNNTPPANFDTFVFNTVPTGGGLYLKVTDTDGATHGLLNINMLTPSPAVNGGFIATAGGATITGWLNTATWTGAATTSAWGTPGNWSPALVPAATSDVVVNSGIYQPNTGGAVTVNSLTVNAGATLTVTGANMTVNGDISVAPGAQISLPISNVGIIAFGNVVTDTLGPTGITGCTGASAPNLNLQPGTHNITGKFCNVANFGTYTATGPIQVVGTAPYGAWQNGNGGNLILNGKRLDTYAFFNGGTGVITMQNALDSLYIHGGTANFNGGSETGLMTAGAIIDRGPTLSVTGTGFDASGGTQTLVVDTAFVQNLNWTSAVPGHGFNDVIMKGTQAKTFGSGDQWITGTLLFDVSMNNISGTVSGPINLHVRTLTDNSTITGGAFNGSTGLHMMGNGTFQHDSLRVNNVHFDAGGNFILSNNLTTNSVVVDSGSGLILNGHTLKTQGNPLTTQNGGVIGMTMAADSIDLGGGSAYFNGGVSQFTKGGFAFGNLYQGWDGAALVPTAAANSFSPTAGLRAHMSTGVGTNIFFQNPGTGSSLSHFWYLQASTSSTARLASDIFVDSLLYGEFSGSNLSSDSAAQNVVRTVTTKGVYNSGTFGMSLGSVAIVLNDGVAASTFFQSVTWTGAYAAKTLFTQNRTTAGPTIGLNNFSGASITTGKWINNIGTGSLTLGVNTGITGSITCTSGGSLTSGSSCP